MRQRGPVEFVAVQTPTRHNDIHHFAESLTMPPFMDVNHLMHENVLERRWRLLRKLALRFSDLIGEACLLPANPSEARNDRHAHGVIVEPERRRHAYSAHRWIHGDVQVLDVLPDHLDRHSEDREATRISTHADS